jgi:hypothetical protein
VHVVSSSSIVVNVEGTVLWCLRRHRNVEGSA